MDLKFGVWTRERIPKPAQPNGHAANWTDRAGDWTMECFLGVLTTPGPETLFVFVVEIVVGRRIIRP
jgi:hypothetical protein